MQQNPRGKSSTTLKQAGTAAPNKAPPPKIGEVWKSSSTTHEMKQRKQHHPHFVLENDIDNE